MQTQIGNTTKSLGREYNLSVSNHGGDEILSSYGLRENTLIISSKVDNNLLDIGTYSLFATDSNGAPVRLTYTIQPGNGLYADPTDTDVLRMVIDESSIMADDGDEIYVNKHNIIDEYTLTVDPDEEGTSKRGRIAVVTANLDKATDLRWGIVKGDENTTYINYEGEWINAYDYRTNSERNFSYILDDDGKQIPTGTISVNTQNLETVDDSYNRNGIVVHSSEMYRTIKAENGKLDVLTYNLDKASVDRYGVVKTDDITIQANDDGIISVLTDGLDHANKNSYGIVKGDEITINSSDDGVLKVNTRNLEIADYTYPGIVSIDSYSMIVDERGKIEVNRYNEIFSTFEENTKEHNAMKADITDLANRVSTLETIAMQERIEFFNAIGDVETILQKPIFDRETWTVDHYTTRQTISFSIRSNCKFNINVEYKPGTNDYNQVTLLSVKYADNAEIPAKLLSNTQFDATGNTVKTVSLTFDLKNYDKDDNNASINTHVKVTVASINDASIKQIGFHIFKCWNNIAFTEEKPADPEVPDVELPHESYWFIHNGTETLYIYGNSEKIASISYNKTGNTNFYFNTKVSATYTYFENNNWYSKEYSGLNGLNQSSEIYDPNSNNSEYNVCIKYQELDDDFKPIDNNLHDISDSDWLNVDIKASYNSTKQFNVLNVVSTDGIKSYSRNAYIYVYLPSHEIILNEGEIVSSFKPEINEKFKNIENIELVSNKNIISKKDLLKYTDSTAQTEDEADNQWKSLDSLTKINIISKELDGNDDVKTVLSKVKLKDTELNIDETSSSELKVVKALNTNRTSIKKAKENYKTSLSVKNINDHENIDTNKSLNSILSNDISEFNLINEEFKKITDTPDSLHKEAYITYYTYIDKLTKLSDKIIDEVNLFGKISYTHNENLNKISNLGYIKFLYSEKLAYVDPIINVATTIPTGNTHSINCTITRNNNSLLTGTDYSLMVYYLFVNKNGDIVDKDGNTATSSMTPYTYSINNINSTPYKTSMVLDSLNGTKTEMVEVENYCNIITIETSTVDRKSLWGIGNGNKDSGIIKWGSYSYSTSTVSSISDPIYAVFKLAGQDASFGLFQQKYSYWGINLKGKKSGYEEMLAQADTIEFVGLSKTAHNKSDKAKNIAQYIKVGKNLYVTKDYAKARAKNYATSDTLNMISKKYYENPSNRTLVLYNKEKIPNTVPNNVSGIKIQDIKVIPNNAFYGEPKVTFESVGSFATTNDDLTKDRSNKYTFGNASITNISILPWDDYSMDIKFTITGGSTTLIPNGSNIIETPSSNNGKTNFVFLKGSSSFEYTQFYNRYSFSSTVWKNNSCTVTYRLYNNYSITATPLTSVNATLYNQNTGKLENMYLEDEIKYGKKNSTRDYTRKLIPLLDYISGIKFWIGLNVSGINVIKKFESSLSSLGNQILFSNTNNTYNNQISKQLFITNALYDNTMKETVIPSITTIPHSTTVKTSTSYSGKTSVRNSLSENILK